ncbi:MULTISPECIES: TonB-dependent siderophore receptor [unclassified Tolypothrix]|uniref:TonB-dependent siderophore receptor n=1 Tax=unclassified Tolypothrix TaxID=2649714 RepID=UPI0006932EC2|nr:MULTISPECIES: TonB-dependent siderophore receptor [unclassified Tolypothrix]MBE9081418.1 TonB-dependent siderophore receptor [Tolypothrix sp. LEGE 11397]UYD25231.1 TonB-dependent siderophore receptor [Tolypothrix sp. PCC 7712]UYD32530.1 TonB-dependent siderophore receptor [Tolypothrix sp. PCC 7601]BAY91141.1 ferrichrome-iron receptor [Microchaete diplosiphon NIES-3275]
MKSGFISEIHSVGLALAVISSLVQPAHAGTQTANLSNSAVQLLVQNNNNLATKVTGVKVTSTDKGIEVILESANIEALKPVSNNQGNSFIADIPNAVLALPTGGNFTQNNPAPGIVSVSVTQADSNTLRVTVVGAAGLPNAELFDGDEGLIFAVTPVASTAQTPQPTPTPSASPTVAEVTGVQLNSTNNGLEIILATPDGEKLQVAPKPEGNTYIADVTAAQLRLSTDNRFRQEKPIAGVSEVTVTNVDSNTIRVAVVGVDTIPKVELFDSDRGLIFGIASTASVTQQPSQEPPSPSEPQAPTAQSDDPIELVVTGEQDSGYNAPDASTATKTDTPLIEIPQAIQVIPRQVIEDQKVQRAADVLRNVSGVTVKTDYAGTDTYTIRGFDTNANLRNGFRQDNFTGFTDTATLDRIEVLKGPASVLYGQLEPGGIVNYITKQPLEEPYYSATFSAGSYSYYRPEIDISGPLTPDKNILYRFVAAYENSGGFRDFADKELYTFAPSLRVKLSDRTTFDLQYEYVNLNQSYDRGLPPIARSFDLPINFNFGEPTDNYELFANRINVALDHRFSENWRFRTAVSVQTVDTSRSNFQPLDFENPFAEDGRTVARRYNKVGDYSREYSWQNDLIGKFKTGSIGHEVLLGFELGRSEFGYPFLISNDVPSLDILNPVYGAAIPTTFDEGFQDRTNTYRVGLYFQDQIALLPNFKMLLGGRLDFVNFKDEFNPDLINGAETETTERYYEKFSPRIGLVYQPTENLSLYASYTRAFKPNEFAIAVGGRPLEPETATQYEVGVKGEFFNGKLTATLAAYEITKNNVSTTDVDNPDFTIAAGEVKSRGFEIDIAGEILPGWNVIASYSHNDAYVTADNSLTVGDRLVNAPRNSASLWTTYQIQNGNLKGLGFGGGLFFVGDREATLPNSITIPSFVRTDAAIFYRRDNYQIGLNFKNLFDTRYYDSAGFLLSPGAPFTVVGTFSIKF